MVEVTSFFLSQFNNKLIPVKFVLEKILSIIKSFK